MSVTQSSACTPIWDRSGPLPKPLPYPTQEEKAWLHRTVIPVPLEAGDGWGCGDGVRNSELYTWVADSELKTSQSNLVRPYLSKINQGRDYTSVMEHLSSMHSKALGSTPQYNKQLNLRGIVLHCSPHLPSTRLPWAAVKVWAVLFS